jgi:hypothetical protein
MSQREFLRELDAEIMSDFTADGLAEEATLTRKDGSVVPCDVMSVYNVQSIGNDGVVVNYAAAITAFLADLTTDPSHGEMFTIDGETFKVDRIELKDQSRVVCLCKAGR